MKKFILTEDDKIRIKKLYNLREQFTLLATIKGSYTASNCDELHAFQGTGGKVIGNMNVMVKEKIQELLNQGHKVKVTNVNVIVNDMKVSWSVDISRSDDNKNWVGFTSRGAGCNQSIETRWDSEDVGNGPTSISANIRKNNIGDVDQIELIKKFNHNGGNNSFIQGFYRYCLKENIEKQNNNQRVNNQIVIKGTDLNDFRNKIREQTQNASINPNQFGKLDLSTFTLTLNSGLQKVKLVTLIWSNISEEDLKERWATQIEKQNPTIESLGDFENIVINGVTYYCHLAYIPI